MLPAKILSPLNPGSPHLSTFFPLLLTLQNPTELCPEQCQHLGNSKPLIRQERFSFLPNIKHQLALHQREASNTTRFLIWIALVFREAHASHTRIVTTDDSQRHLFLSPCVQLTGTRKMWLLIAARQDLYGRRKMPEQSLHHDNFPFLLNYLPWRKICNIWLITSGSLGGSGARWEVLRDGEIFGSMTGETGVANQWGKMIFLKHST